MLAAGRDAPLTCVNSARAGAGIFLAMPWTIDILDDPKAVSSTLIGPMKLVVVKEVAAAALKLGAEKRVDKFLEDARGMQPELTTLEIHGLPDTFGKLGLGKLDKVAIVYTESSPQAADFRFFETAALNRGYTVRLFTRSDAALRWLRGG